MNLLFDAIKPFRKTTLLSYIILSFLFVNSLEAQWKQLSVGQSGEVHVVTAIGSDVFAGTEAGIYRSTDEGKNWTNVSSYYARCFAVNGSEILAGTYMNGVVRSTDGGKTWVMTNTSFHHEIDAIAINGNYIFAGGSGMYRSTDDGSTWELIQNGLQWGQNMITGLVVTEGKVLSSTFYNVCISTDNGNDWSTLVTTTDYPMTNCISIIDSTILVGWIGGILRSTDDGRSWSQINGPSEKFFITGDSSHIYAGTISGVQVSTDGGVTWMPIDNGLPGGQVWCVAANGAILYSATNSGVYKSTDQGNNWALSSQGIVGWSADYISGMENNIFTITSSSDAVALYNSTDNGNTWTEDTSLHYWSQSITVTNPYVYVVTYSAILVSSDNGKSWANIIGSLMDTVNPTQLIKSGSNLIVSTRKAGEVLLSSNNGASWKNVGTNLPAIVSLASTGNYVYAGDAGDEGDWTQSYGGIYRSTDNGENWTQINDTLKNISSLAANGPYVIAGRYVPPIPGTDTVLPPLGGVFLSTDNGQTWSTFENGLPQYPHVHSLAINNKDVFVGLSGAYGNYSGPVYYSNISGNSWTAIGDGLPYSQIYSIYVNDSSIFIDAGFAGIWQMPLSDITDVKQINNIMIPSQFRLEQNYPNPFNPTTVIEYSLPAESLVKLEVFDILGRKISTLINKNQRAGIHSVNFNAGNLTSGVYFYRITAGNLVAAKKLLLIK